jgi:Fe-S-cluster containining protein
MLLDTSFPCTRCGLCCRRVNNHKRYKHLDRGDGVCRNLIESNNLCSIYEQRPPECRIDFMYDKLYSAIMTQQEYYDLNLAACGVLAAAKP